jgi:hypothetical protein
MLPNVDIRAAYRIDYHFFALLFLSAGLLLKPFVIRRITGFSLGRLMVANAALNVASHLCLGAAVPAAIVLCLLLNERVLKPFFRTDDYASIVWLGVVSIATVASAAAEALVLNFVFKKRMTGKAFLLLCGANALCMVITSYGTHKHILANPPEA